MVQSKWERRGREGRTEWSVDGDTLFARGLSWARCHDDTGCSKQLG